MNIREIIGVYKSVLPLNLERDIKAKTEPNVFATNLIAFRYKVDRISKVMLLHREIQIIKESSIFQSLEDQWLISTSEYHKLQDAIGKIHTICQSFENYQKSISDVAEDYLVLLRLPEVSDFDELSKVSNDLKKAIQLPIIDQNKNGMVKIESAEPGSIWLTIYLGSIAAVTLVSKICHAAINLKKENARANMLVDNGKMMGMVNEQLEMLHKVSKTHFESTLQHEASSIMSSEYSDADPEKMERLKLAVNTFNELIDKGTKVIALTQNVEVKNQFPDFNPLNFLPSPPKQIGDSDKKE